MCVPVRPRVPRKVAVPFSRLPTPNSTVPSMKVTVPVGTDPPPSGATVAVKVTVSSQQGGLGEIAKTVVVLGLGVAIKPREVVPS
jgi:hypothetical protein